MANNFMAKFKSLRCIGDNNLALCTIDSFYDYTNEMFAVFCDDHCFLPKQLQGNEIKACLKFFGLRTAPTADDFLNFATKWLNFAILQLP